MHDMAIPITTITIFFDANASTGIAAEAMVKFVIFAVKIAAMPIMQILLSFKRTIEGSYFTKRCSFMNFSWIKYYRLMVSALSFAIV